MKKQVLLTTGIVISGLLSAQVSKQVLQKSHRIPSNLANIAIPKNKINYDAQPAGINHNPANSTKKPGDVKRTEAVTIGVIGTTYYDTQSNSSVPDRIVVNADGSIAAVWTMELTSDKTYPNRGTGYAYFNGTAWSPAPTANVEPTGTRVGWGNIANTRTGKELILSHDGTTNKLNLSSRAVKGAGTWAQTETAVVTATTGGNFWPRLVSSGDTVYALSLTQPTVTAGAATYQGLNGAICFHRSKNGGATWDINNVIPTGLDNTTRFTGFTADAYAIAAKGNTVVVVGGDSDKDIVMSKSTDGGTTWTPTTVMKFPIARFNGATMTTDVNGDAIPDTLDTNDGTFAIGLDNNGKAYVFYGHQRVLCQTAGTASGQGLQYFPITDGLMMWKEGFQANTDTGGVLVAAIEDLGTQGSIFFPSTATGDLPVGRWGNSLTSFPSVAFDASNTMYLSYSSVVDSLISLINSTKLVRHQYVIKSTDGGTTWTNPCDIVGLPSGIPYEGVFGSMAKRVDGNVHIVYQRDLGPGGGVPGANPGDNPDENDNVSSNDIVYFKFPVSEIGACALGVGIKEQSSAVSDLKFYPNPASTSGTLEITLNDNFKMDISILNSIGQVVYATSVTGNAGTNKVDLNLSSLNSGMYFYQVKTGSTKTITNKFVIAK